MKVNIPPVSELLQQAGQQLQAVSDTPQLDAQLLLAHCLGKDVSFLFSHPETSPDLAQYGLFRQLLSQREVGIPVAYLVGEKEFWSIPLKVTPDVLIPRPETELLVEQTLKASTAFAQPHILELGTGSGAIAITLSRELPHARITATDLYGKALAIAEDNARQHGADIHFIRSLWFSHIPDDTRYDIIVSNPPYIAQDDPHLQGNIRHEPRTALVAGKDGLDAIRIIVEHAQTYLNSGGILLLEHGYDQAQPVRELLERAGYQQCQTCQDMAGMDRVSTARKP